LTKVNVAAAVGVKADELTDAHLLAFCVDEERSSASCHPCKGEIIDLKDCSLLVHIDAFLKGQEQIQQLDISGCDSVDPSDVALLLTSLGALSTFTFGRSTESATMHVGMTVCDLSDKGLGPSDAKLLAAWLIHKEDGTLTTLDISDNNLGVRCDSSTNWYDVLDLTGIVALADAIKNVRACYEFQGV
jgi:hypothetical protein